MLKPLHVQVLIVFNTILFIMDINGKQRIVLPKDMDNATNGEQFIKKVIRGESVISPGYLMFTAPYRLCEGECKTDSKNFIMSFPLYMGKKGINIYKRLFNRDFKKIHHNKPNAPFKRRTSRAPVTYCPTYKTSKTVEVTTSSTIIDLSMTDNSVDTNEGTFFNTIDTTPWTTTEDVSYITTAVETEKTPIITHSSIANKVDITNSPRCPEVVPRSCRKKLTTLVELSPPNENYFYNYNDNGANEQKKEMSDDYNS